jgi:hypothetical protein
MLFKYRMAQEICVFLPLDTGEAEVSVVINLVLELLALAAKRSLFGVLPLFVPSLSWQDDRFYIENRPQSTIFFLPLEGGDTPLEARSAVGGCEKRRHSFLNFPMFVPSLSWHLNVRFCNINGAKSGAFRTRFELEPQDVHECGRLRLALRLLLLLLARCCCELPLHRGIRQVDSVRLDRPCTKNKTHISLFECFLSLVCLSRACLGKMMHFSTKLLNKGVFSHQAARGRRFVAPRARRAAWR